MNRDYILDALLNHTQAVIYFKDLDGRYTMVNKRWLEIFGHAESDVIGKIDYEIHDELEYAQAFRENDMLVQETGEACEFEETAPQLDGVHTYVSIKFPVFDSSRKICGIGGVSTDITERKMIKEELLRKNEALEKEIAFSKRLMGRLKDRMVHDPLTGAYNRPYFKEMFARELARSRRNDLPLGLVMIDIDYFKKVNDTHGHEVGDRVLVLLVEVAGEILREKDFMARLGGEEFALVLPGSNRTATVQIAERFRKAFEETKCGLTEDRSISCTFSAGVSLYPDHAQDEIALLKRADEALYASKESGRNQVFVATEEIPQVSRGGEDHAA